MIIQNLHQTLSDEVALSPNRSSAITNETIKNSTVTSKVIVPEKFRKDIDTLETYIDSSLSSGLCITVKLSELLAICPRSRRRVDAYKSLETFLREEMSVILKIKTSKSKKQ